MKIYDSSYFFRKIVMEKEGGILDIILKKQNAYYKVNVPKKDGTRLLCCIRADSPLAEMQRRLKKHLFENIPISTRAYGFVQGRSYRDFLLPHIQTKNKRNYLRLDISNFFDSIRTQLVTETFAQYVCIEDSQEKDSVLRIIAGIVTLDDSLPQGAITSPVLSNIVFRRLDLRISKYCRRLGVHYTRYADDLLFSSENSLLQKPFFTNMISKILRSGLFNFHLNFSKTIRNAGQISLGGFVVGQEVRLSRKRFHDINLLWHIFHSGGKPATFQDYLARINQQSDMIIFRNLDVNNELFSGKESLLHYLCGYRSFFIQWLPKRQDSYYNEMKKALNRLETLIINVEELP